MHDRLPTIRRCKMDVGFELCSNPGAMSIVDGVNELRNCLEDMPECRRNRQVCLGQCSGNATQLQDFMTYATKSELSARVIGSERLAKGRANCSTHLHTFEVDLFEGIGDAWIAYSSRLRVRGGFNGTRSCAFQPTPPTPPTLT